MKGRTQWPARPPAANSGTAADLLRFAIRYAVLAPSSHNTQPWRFTVDGSVLGLYRDPARRLPVVDPDDREQIISCGAALLTLRTALAHFGRDVAVRPFPRGPGADLLARVTVTGDSGSPDARTADLFAAILQRHTSRHAFVGPVPEPVVAELCWAAELEGGRLCVVPPDHQADVAYMIADADLTQMDDPRFRRELAHWMRGNHTRRGDGIPGAALGLTELQSMMGPLVVRTFDVGMAQAAKDQELVRHSPVLAVLTTDRDDRHGWLAAGQALQRVLLEATVAGLRASFLNQPIELPSMRARLRTHLQLAGHPQLLLRLGYGPPGEPTPRRPLADVVPPARRRPRRPT